MLKTFAQRKAFASTGRSYQWEEHYLTTNKVHVVSRKGQGDIVLAGDESVSRTHAKLEVLFDKAHVNNPAFLPEVFLVECNSKYGTFVNKGISTNSRLPVGTRLQLKDGDRVRFGIQYSEWKLEHVPLIITTSTLNADQKMSLSETVAQLGGHVVPDWRDDCTHVTMNKITLTVKVVCALARGRYIVAPEYWQQYVCAATSRSKLPDYTSHVPPLAERSLSARQVSFTVDERRASLFKGKLFVFHSVEQHNAFSCMVFAAGGLCVIADGCGMSTEEMLAPHVVVMGYPFERGSQETQFTDSFKKLKSFLMSNGKRLISESEIGLAVLHCSMERYCNPQFSADKILTNQSQASLGRNSSANILKQASQRAGKSQNTESSQDSFPSLRTKRRNKVPVLVVESDSDSSGPEPDNIVAPATKTLLYKANNESAEHEDTGSRKRLRSLIDTVEKPTKKLASEARSGNQIQIVQQCDDILPKMKELKNATKLASTLRTDTMAKEMLLSNSRQGRSNSKPSQDFGAKCVSRRKRESSSEEEPLFTFVDEPRKLTRQRVDSDDEGSSMFAFVDEVKTNQAVSRKRTVSNSDNSDNSDVAGSDDEGGAKFVFVEDPSTKFAEKYFPDSTWAASNKRHLQEVENHEMSLDQPPLKRQFIEPSRKMANQTVRLEDFISAVKIRNESSKDKDYVSALPDYVLGLNNTVVVTVGAVVTVNKAEKDSARDETDGPNIKNCKKFKKVTPFRRNIVPTIIGGSDLMVAHNNSQGHLVNGDVVAAEERLESTFHFVDD